MTKVRTRKLSEQDRSLLETLGKFTIRAKNSSWDDVNHHNDAEAVTLLREISPLVSSLEYNSLMSGWSTYRLSSNELELNSAVESITRRVQEGTETY
jgi:hypothetical protein